MEIALDLQSHCIETEIKRLYEHSVRRYFQPDADEAALEARIELLKKALEHFDFRGLRSRYPELCGHTDAGVVLYSDSDDVLKIRIDDTIIEVD